MTLEQYAYVGELIATGALVISLIYVGIQVKLGTQATRAGTAQSYVDTMNAYVGLRHWFDDDFRSYVEELVEQQSGIQMHFRAFQAQT